QLGLLRAIAERADFATESYHFDLALAARLTRTVFDGFCHYTGQLTGEWLFSVAAFGDDAPADDDAYFRAFPDVVQWAKDFGKDTAYLSSLRHEVLPAYLGDCLAAADWGRYQVVGFSSTFQQNVASLGLARRIKERYPAVRVVFGGANLAGDMG